MNCELNCFALELGTGTESFELRSSVLEKKMERIVVCFLLRDKRLLVFFGIIMTFGFQCLKTMGEIEHDLKILIHFEILLLLILEDKFPGFLVID